MGSWVEQQQPSSAAFSSQEAVIKASTRRKHGTLNVLQPRCCIRGTLVPFVTTTKPMDGLLSCQLCKNCFFVLLLLLLLLLRLLLHLCAVVRRRFRFI
jgi:hypothetical protein